MGSGALSSTGTYITWVDPATNALTIVVNKPAGSSTESATFTLTGPAASITKLNVWHSAVTRGDNPDLTPYYNAQPAIAVTGGSFTVSLKAGDLYTFTTVSTVRVLILLFISYRRALLRLRVCCAYTYVSAGQQRQRACTTRDRAVPQEVQR